MYVQMYVYEYFVYILGECGASGTNVAAHAANFDCVRRWCVC